MLDVGQSLRVVDLYQVERPLEGQVRNRCGNDSDIDTRLFAQPQHVSDLLIHDGRVAPVVQKRGFLEDDRQARPTACPESSLSFLADLQRYGYGFVGSCHCTDGRVIARRLHQSVHEVLSDHDDASRFELDVEQHAVLGAVRLPPGLLVPALSHRQELLEPIVTGTVTTAEAADVQVPKGSLTGLQPPQGLDRDALDANFFARDAALFAHAAQLLTDAASDEGRLILRSTPAFTVMWHVDPLPFCPT